MLRDPEWPELKPTWTAELGCTGSEWTIVFWWYRQNKLGGYKILMQKVAAHWNWSVQFNVGKYVDQMFNLELNKMTEEALGDFSTNLCRQSKLVHKNRKTKMGIRATHYLLCKEAIETLLGWLDIVSEDHIRILDSELHPQFILTKNPQNVSDTIERIKNEFNLVLESDEKGDYDWEAMRRLGDALDYFVADKFSNFLVYPTSFTVHPDGPEHQYENLSAWRDFVEQR